MTIEISQIFEGQRLREVSEAQVAALMESISDIGLLNPVTVYPLAEQFGEERYGLVAGAHRVEACRRLGMSSIDAHVVNLGQLERQIAECDENLCSSRLTPSEKALFIKRRKQAYEALHPETRHGENQHTRSRQIDDSSKRFTADTASKTGMSERTVQRNAERGERISVEAIEIIRTTNLDTGQYLDTLKSLPISEQAKRARADLRTAKQPKVISADDATEHQFAALRSAWNKASVDARERFLARIQSNNWTGPLREPASEETDHNPVTGEIQESEPAAPSTVTGAGGFPSGPDARPADESASPNNVEDRTAKPDTAPPPADAIGEMPAFLKRNKDNSFVKPVEGEG